MPESIFSTYRAGENRVTASILAVLRCLALSRIETLLGGLLQQSEFEFVRFKNQPKGDSSVPDAEVSSNCRILIEAKIARGAVDPEQLVNHLRGLDQTHAATQILLVLTPDAVKPSVLSQIKDERVVGASFASLDELIERTAWRSRGSNLRA